MTLGERTERGRRIAERSLDRWTERLGEPEGLEDHLALRLAHATWDPFIAETLRVVPSEREVVRGLRRAELVAVDVEMVRAGIRRSLRRLGLEALVASREGRSSARDTVTGDGMRRILSEHERVAVVVGNAPTAAEKVGEHRESVSVALLMPVGLGSLEVKFAALDWGIPLVTNLSMRGGTPMAVAAFNALVDYALES
ncbi:MAG: precorrin-8X methylmutase [Euryarchaeota archaeon]